MTSLVERWDKHSMHHDECRFRRLRSGHVCTMSVSLEPRALRTIYKLIEFAWGSETRYFSNSRSFSHHQDWRCSVISIHSELCNISSKWTYPWAWGLAVLLHRGAKNVYPVRVTILPLYKRSFEWDFPPLTMRLPTSTILLFSFLISSADAQVYYRRRRSSLGRIIAGCVVGEQIETFGVYLDNRSRSQHSAGLFAILFCFLLIMMRRRRQRQRMASATTQAGIPPNIQLGNKPTFNGPWGGPWGQATAPSNQVSTSAYGNQGQNYNSYNNAAQNPSNIDYPNQSPLPPPPAYGQDANNHGHYAAVRTFSILLMFYVEKRISPLDPPHICKDEAMINPTQRYLRPVIMISVKTDHPSSLLALRRRLSRLIKMMPLLGVFESSKLPRMPPFYVVPFLTLPWNLPLSHERMSNRFECILIMMDSLTCGMHESWFLNQDINFYMMKRFPRLRRLRLKWEWDYERTNLLIACGIAIARKLLDIGRIHFRDTGSDYILDLWSADCGRLSQR